MHRPIFLRKRIFAMKLNNGIEIPSMGFGTYRMAPEDTVASVKCAIAAGWKHIDTATIYGNEKEVGQAVRESGVPRSELFITTKLQGLDRGYDSALKAFDHSLESLGMDYIDLYLIHWPASPFFHDDWKKQNADSWKAMERLYREGRIRAIGLSNFMPRHAEELLKTAEIFPMVDQIEFHPGWLQNDCTRYCREKGIVLEAWAPLVKGDILGNEIICSIAAAHDCSAAQVVLSWVHSQGIIPLCKSNTPSRIAENLLAPGITLSDEEVGMISSISGAIGRQYNPDCCNF